MIPEKTIHIHQGMRVMEFMCVTSVGGPFRTVIQVQDKKICGTLEGYEFVDSEETSLSALSDDDHVSDEDPKTPSPKGLERSSNEKGSGGIGNRSNRSEDEVFMDAIVEFPDSGSSLVTGEHMRDVQESEIDLEFYKATAQTSKDGLITATSATPSNSADHIQMQSTEAPVSNLSGKAQESLDHDSNATIGFMTGPLTDCRAEESGFQHSHDNGGSAYDSIPIELKTETDASQENKKIGAGEDFSETGAKGHEGTKFERQLLDVVVSANDAAGEASEMVSKLQNMEDVTSEPVPTAEFLQLKEDHADVLASGMSLNDLSPEVKSDEPVDSSIDAAQIKGDADQEMDFADYVNSTESSDDKGEGDEKVHVLIVPHDFPVVADAEKMVKGFKDHGGEKLPQLMNVDLFEVFNNVKDSDTKDNPSGFNSRPLTKDTKVSTSDLHALDDKLEPKVVASQFIVEELPAEAEADVPQSSEFGVTDVVAGDLEKSISVQSPEVPLDHCETSSPMSYLEHATNAISVTNTVVVATDAEVRQRNLAYIGNHDKDKIESSEIAVNDITNRNVEENCAENRIPTLSVPSKQVDQRNSVLGDVNAAAHGEGKIERCNVSEIETEGDSLSGLGEENLPREPKATPQSALNVESNFTSLNGSDVCEGMLSEHEHTDLGRVLDPQDSRKEPESNTMVNLQEHAGEASTGAESDGCGDVEVLWKSSKDKMVREALVSPPETSSSLQNSSPVADDHARNLLAVASGDTSDFLPDEGDHNIVTQQAVASAMDFSVDSSSHTDSLEGHWGSVSVLSTQPDISTILNCEPLTLNGSQALSEADKATSKEPRAASDTEQADKSDVFEAPSFMTLVEPRDGINQKAAASEIQTTQNLQQQKVASLQAGWFPSITNVVKESRGRKKNEEIIAKVTSWGTGKQHPPLKSPQHSPLKSLLGEARMETKSKSPNAKKIPVDKAEPAANNNGALPKTVSPILVPQEPLGEPVKDEEKAWSFPARYPADMKREERKVKGRPFWAQFVCCSSLY